MVLKTLKLKYATGWVRHLGSQVPGLLWRSIPCTGGSRRNDMNLARHTEKFQKNLRAKRAYARTLWKNFERTAELALQFGWGIAIEWPNACSYWKWPAVTKFLERHGLRKAYCRGCAVGLKDDMGVPIAKPWRIETNVPELHRTLDACRCPGKAAHPVHAECQGKYVPLSEGYTPMLARKVHKAC